MNSPRSLSPPAALLLLLALVATGCGGKGNVSGTISFEGKSIPFGRISLLFQDGNQKVFTATVRNGHYQFRDLPIGPVKIAVESSRIRTTRFQPPKGKSIVKMPGDLPPPDADTAPPVDAKHYVRIPPQYSNPSESPLNYTVIKGDQVFDIPLEP